MKPEETATTEESVSPEHNARPRRTGKSPLDEDPFNAALSPFTMRMRRLNFTPEILRTRFRSGIVFSEDEIALDWVGMPNKNERKLVSDLCQACATAGLLIASGDRQWCAIAQATDAMR